ncbi:MAG: epoxyqueuosine reductase QueH [Candidatus Magasanikbacteria bacterium]
MKKFLLHTCCAPCSIAIIEELKSQFDVTVFFYNPNIHPQTEYLKRKEQVIKVCKQWGIKMIDADYDPQNWYEKVRGLVQEPEGGNRCSICFEMRMAKAVQYAKENNFDIWSSSLTFGRNKRSDVINPIGLSLQEKYSVEYYDEDWKKKGRQERSNKLVGDMNIYRQDYCGCVYSLRDKKLWKAKIKEKGK